MSGARYRGGLGSRIVRTDVFGRAAILAAQVSPELRRVAVAARVAGLQHVEYDGSRVYAADPRTGERCELTCQADVDRLVEHRP